MGSFKNGIIRKIKIFAIFLLSEILATILVIAYMLLLDAVIWVARYLSFKDPTIEFIAQLSHLAGIPLFIITTLMLNIELLFILIEIFREGINEIKGVCNDDNK